MSSLAFRRPRFTGSCVILITIFSLGGCQCGEEDETISIYHQEDKFGEINFAAFDDGRIVKRDVSELPDDSVRDEHYGKPAGEPPIQQQVDKVHPHLQELITRHSSDLDHRVRVVITFADDRQFPRFPDPFHDQPRDSDPNNAVKQRADSLIDSIRQSRAVHYDSLEENFRSRFEPVDVERFWLIHAIAAEMPLSAVDYLNKHPDVVHVRADTAGETPPSDGSNNVTVAMGRQMIGSDPYFDLGLKGGYIGLLDSGVLPTHKLLVGSVDYKFDCSDGVCDDKPDPAHDSWDHGTATAAIISGSDSRGDDYRGVSGITIDSYKVFPEGKGYLSAEGAIRAFEKAVSVSDRVIVAEMQAVETPSGPISTAANKAFDAGAVVVAANGNNGALGAGSVNAPALAHKVIGVGSYQALNLVRESSQSCGPASDGRIKPDLQAPTQTETASSASNVALKVIGGTSGATPYVAGAAALLRNWLKGESGGVDPGQVYAELILSGSAVGPFDTTDKNCTGAGPLKLQSDRHSWWGKVLIKDQKTAHIPLKLPGDAAATLFAAASWWPESPGQTHSDIDIEIIDPNGARRAVSLEGPSVFERVTTSGPIPSGTWTLKIQGFSVPKGTQTVYWAAHATQ